MSELFNRRNAMGIATATAAGAAGAALSTMSSKPAYASLGASDFEPRGAVGILERLPSMDLESYNEMSMSTRQWINTELNRAAEIRARMILQRNGLDPQAPMKLETAIELLSNDPVIDLRNHTWQRLQRHLFMQLQREFNDNYDMYMSEMEAADNAGPGALELNPGIEPEYAKHEIHMQPGGYTGNEFAGHMYHYGTLSYHLGDNDQDERQTALAASAPVPGDGRIKRILDMGTGCGQYAVALKKRFPDAEVWGLDVGAPMVRYAHMRAVDIGVDVNFRHATAEDTGFPDGYFDLVTSYILHHEVTEQATYDIIREAERLVRPGGLFYPIDLYTNPGRRPDDERGMVSLRGWTVHRWNHERYWYDYKQADFNGEMERVGFEVLESGPKAQVEALFNSEGGFPNVVGMKPL